MAKRMLDQTMAWILAIMGSTAVFSGVYLGTKFVAKKDHIATHVEDHPAEEDAPKHATGDGGSEHDVSKDEHSASKNEHDASKDEHSAGDNHVAAAKDSDDHAKQDGGGHEGKPHWSYAGATGPENWGAMSPEFELCDKGRVQTPIDLKDAKPAKLASRLSFHYVKTEARVVNNGHTLQVNYSPGSYIKTDGDRFELLQFHFHAPSEHKIDGAPYEMELHLVHKNKKNQLAVVGLMIEEGRANKAIAPIWKNLPGEVDGEGPSAVINAAELLPSRWDYFRYGGSLTTPPCSEGVKWHVLTMPIQFSGKQIESFTQIHKFTARPLQALHGRKLDIVTNRDVGH